MNKYSTFVKKRVAIVTNNINCERHIQYYSTIEKYFIINGWEVVEDFDANKVIICGCGFHDMMYEKVLEVFNELKKIHYLDRNVIIMGCLPKTHEERLRRDFNGQVIALHGEELLDDIIQAKIPFGEIELNNLFTPHEACQLQGEDQLFYIKISEGCFKGCTFCVINKAKGFLRSVPVDEIVRQFKKAVDGGKRKIFLMGEDTFAYGMDIGTNIIELVETLIDIDSDVEFYFGSLHIKWLWKYSKELVLFCKRGVTKKLHIGLQHVNSELLKTMGRPIEFSCVYETIGLLKKECPGLYIGVDILVGFPGETREMFEELVEFFKKDNCIDNVQLNGYSDVEGAPSAKFKDKIPTAEITRRWTYLNDTILGERSAFNRVDETSNEDITFRLTQKQSHAFCKDTFKDKLNRVVSDQGLHTAESSILKKDQMGFEF